MNSHFVRRVHNFSRWAIRRSPFAICFVAYALDVPLDDVRNTLYDIRSRLKGNLWGNGKVLHMALDTAIDNLVAKGDIRRIQHNAKFNVGVTAFFNQYHVHSHWKSVDQLKRVMRKRP